MPELASRLPKLRIRTILLAVNVIVILVPLSSGYFFHLFENELVRQTEAELVAQGAFIAADFIGRIPPERTTDYGIPATHPEPVVDATYHPHIARLDLAEADILPPRPDVTPGPPPDPLAARIGQALAPIIAEARLTTLASVSLLDVQGVCLLGKEKGASFLAVGEVRAALAGETVAVIRRRISEHPMPAIASISRGTDIRVFVAMPILRQGRVMGAILLSRSPRNVLKALYEERRGAVAASTVVLLALLLISGLTSRAIGRPVRALLRQVRDVAEGRPVSAIARPVTAEMAELSGQIVRMARRLHERSDYIRRFALHLSHEFKTPLTAIQGALELMQEYGPAMSPEERRRFLDNTLQDTARLGALVTRMLELARADAMEPARERCELAPAIHRMADRYRAQGMTVVSTSASPDLRVPIGADMWETVLVNLIENSAQHGADRIEFAASVAAGAVRLEVSDNGRGISSANAARLFTPFFTTRREQGGTGLGLSIVQALLAANGATIRLAAAQPHARFEIVFP